MWEALSTALDAGEEKGISLVGQDLSDQGWD